MSNIRDVHETERIKTAVMLASAKLFMENGYTATTVRQIAEAAGLSKSTLMYEFKSKEDILALLVSYVLEGQFTAASKMLRGMTDDPILFYAVETTLQLYMAESGENVRDLYAAAYSLPASSAIIQRTITGKLENIFRDHLSHLQTKDFYELEIASGGIMRSFMTVPCDMYFTIERKVARFLETTFLVYRVPDEKIRQAIEFVGQFDYPAVARQTIQHMLDYLEKCLE